MDKKNVLFLVLVLLSVMAALYCFISDFFSSAKKMVENGNPISDIVEQNKDAIDIISDIGDFVADNTGKLFPQTPEEVDGATTSQSSAEKYDCLGTIQSITDGGTYIININGTDTTVCLIGICFDEDTESGIVVSEIVKSYLKQGDTVFLEYDIGRTDPSGNTLAYVYFENGTMVQRWLLSNGYVQSQDIPPNSKYAAQFAALEQKAKDNKVGLWAYMENAE